MSSKKKLLFVSALGNALEFYDFTLYGVLATVLATHYFPGNDDTAKLLFSLAAFGVGFLTRPIGAVFFGHLGDSFGRKNALSLSILLMGLPTLIIGIMPSYHQIGLSASLMVFICRLLQGIFTGGEYNGAAIFSIEHFDKKQSGLVGGLITGSCVIGAMIATALGALSQHPTLPTWAWRMPFIIGGIFGLLGFFMRKSVKETPEFTSTAPKQKLPLLEIFTQHQYSSFVAFMFGGFNGALSYTLFGFLNIYLSRYLHVPFQKALEYNLFGLAAFLIGSPFMGSVLDKLGKEQFLRIINPSIFLLLLPIFKLLHLEFFIIAQILLGLCTASIAGSCHAIMQDLFPVKERCRGISINFSLGMGLFGGISPIIYVHMIERIHLGLFFPPIFLMILALCFTLSIQRYQYKKTTT